MAKVSGARRLLVSGARRLLVKVGVDPLYRQTKTAMGFLMLSEALNLTLTLTRALFGKKSLKMPSREKATGLWREKATGLWREKATGLWREKATGRKMTKSIKNFKV